MPLIIKFKNGNVKFDYREYLEFNLHENTLYMVRKIGVGKEVFHLENVIYVYHNDIKIYHYLTANNTPVIEALRKLSGHTFADCKSALIKSDYDINLAIGLLMCEISESEIEEP